MAWRPFSSTDPLPPPPEGFERAHIRAGDDLGKLEREAKDTAGRIAAANGVAWPGRKSCVWSRDVCAMVLASGGHRNPVVPGSPNVCEVGIGHCVFTTGQVLNLPVGLRERARAQPPTKVRTPASSSGAAAGLGILALLGLGLATVAGGKKGKAAA